MDTPVHGSVSSGCYGSVWVHPHWYINHTSCLSVVFVCTHTMLWQIELQKPTIADRLLGYVISHVI